MKLKINDTVMIISGKDKGLSGPITSIDRTKNRVKVEKANMKTNYNKRSASGPGSMNKEEAWIHASNVMIIDPKTKKRSRVGYRTENTGKKKTKVRFAKVSGEVLP